VLCRRGDFDMNNRTSGKTSCVRGGGLTKNGKRERHGLPQGEVYHTVNDRGTEQRKKKKKQEVPKAKKKRIASESWGELWDPVARVGGVSGGVKTRK